MPLAGGERSAVVLHLPYPGPQLKHAPKVVGKPGLTPNAGPSSTTTTGCPKSCPARPERPPAARSLPRHAATRCSQATAPRTGPDLASRGDFEGEARDQRYRKGSRRRRQSLTTNRGASQPRAALGGHGRRPKVNRVDRPGSAWEPFASRTTEVGSYALAVEHPLPARSARSAAAGHQCRTEPRAATNKEGNAVHPAIGLDRAARFRSRCT